MSCITIHKGLASNPEFDTFVKEIELSHTPIGSGGFGEIYSVLSVQKHVCSDVVCKLFYPSPLSYRNFQSIQLLQTQYTQKKSILGDALKTLPLFSFEGFMLGKPVYGYLMRYLSEKEFANFSVFMEDKNALEAYYNLNFTQKIGYAKSLATQIHALQQLNFIHADISADNIFIHLHKPEVALIDFDSGTVIKDKAKPTTWGKPNEWVEPQIMFDLAKQQKNKLPTVSVNFFSDVWSAHIGLHYLLFMVHPFFFIRSLSEKNMRLYFEHYMWPNAYQGKCDEIFATEAKIIHQKYLQMIQQTALEPILHCFEQTFNEGFFNPEKRTDISTWVKVLQEYDISESNYTLPVPVIVKKTNYSPLKAPKLRPKYGKKTHFQPQRKSFYPKYHQKGTVLPLSYISSLKTLPHTGNNITTSQMIKLILVNAGIIVVVFGLIQLWENMNKNKWIEKFKNIQPVIYDTTQVQGKNPALKKEYEQYTRYEKATDSLQKSITKIKQLSMQEITQVYEKSTQTLTQIQNRDDSLFKAMMRYKGQPDSLYIAYQKWLRSYNTLIEYQKAVDSLKKIVQK